MKIHKSDIYHVIIGLILFRWVWLEATHTFNSTNGIWFGFLAILLLAILKEFNDRNGWFKWALSNGKKTGFNAADIWKGILIPLIVMSINYLLYK